jgi:integrase/recombinase XerD
MSIITHQKRWVIFLLVKFAIQDFIDDRKIKNLSQDTISGYQRDLGEFRKWLEETYPDITNIEDVKEKHIKEYFQHLINEKNNNAVTINHKLIYIRAFFNYLVQEKIIKETPVKIKKPKLDVKIEALTDEQVYQILRYFRKIKTRDKTFYAYRNYLMILTFLGTGVRLGELINIRWRDIDLYESKLTVFGKARKQRTIPLHEKLQDEFKEYRIFAKKKGIDFKEDDFVFTDMRKRQLTKNAIHLILKRLKQAMNWKDVSISQTVFRHTFAKNWIISGGDVFSLQRVLGHTQLTTTNRYVSLFGSALKEQNDKHNPLNKIDFFI